MFDVRFWGALSLLTWALVLWVIGWIPGWVLIAAAAGVFGYGGYWMLVGAMTHLTRREKDDRDSA